MKDLNDTHTGHRGAAAGIQSKEHLAHGPVYLGLQNPGLANVSSLYRNAKKAHLQGAGNFVFPEPSLQRTRPVEVG
jgi:hypothetical protein